jgi:hypothetical protein
VPFVVDTRIYETVNSSPRGQQALGAVVSGGSQPGPGSQAGLTFPTATAKRRRRIMQSNKNNRKAKANGKDRQKQQQLRSGTGFTAA